MRLICWVTAVVLIGGLVSPALAIEPIPEAMAETWPSGGAWDAAAPPCGVWCFGMVPGCCRCPPSCCDNAWEGYCEKKGCPAWRVRRAVCPERVSACPPRLGWRMGLLRWSHPVTDCAVASPDNESLDPQPEEQPKPE